MTSGDFGGGGCVCGFYDVGVASEMKVGGDDVSAELILRGIIDHHLLRS